MIRDVHRDAVDGVIRQGCWNDSAHITIENRLQLGSHFGVANDGIANHAQSRHSAAFEEGGHGILSLMPDTGGI